MEGFFDRYNRLLSDRDLIGIDDDALRTNLSWRPRADISDSKKEYLIKAELPEVERDDIHIAIENGMLTISGERTNGKGRRDGKATSHREFLWKILTKLFTSIRRG